HLLAVSVEISLDSLREDLIGQLTIGLIAIRLTNLDSKRHADAIDVADHSWIATVQRLQRGEEVCPFGPSDRLVVELFHHPHGLETNRGAECVRGECRVGGSWREDFRRDEILTRPYTAQGIQAVGQRLAEDEDVGLDAEVLDRPEFPRTIK